MLKNSNYRNLYYNDQSLTDIHINVGDYVIINDDCVYPDIVSNQFRDYLNSHIGIIYRIRTRNRNNKPIYQYDIEYKDAPDEVNRLLSHHHYDFSIVYYESGRDYYEIEYCSKDKEELELILNSKKFNI